MIEIRQWFKHRVDKLISRELNKTTNTVVEQFAPGRPRFLKGVILMCPTILRVFV